jgi:hypothetical protein
MLVLLVLIISLNVWTLWIADVLGGFDFNLEHFNVLDVELVAATHSKHSTFLIVYKRVRTDLGEIIFLSQSWETELRWISFLVAFIWDHDISAAENHHEFSVHKDSFISKLFS